MNLSLRICNALATVTHILLLFKFPSFLLHLANTKFNSAIPETSTLKRKS